MFNGNEKQHPAPFVQGSLCWTALLRLVCHAHPGRPAYLKANRQQTTAEWRGKSLSITHPLCHRDPPTWSPELPQQVAVTAHWASSHLTSCRVGEITSLNYCSPRPQWPWPDNAEDAIPQQHIPCCCPCPEAGIWPPNIQGWAVTQLKTAFHSMWVLGRTSRNPTAFR